MEIETPQRAVILARLRDEIRRLERRPDRRPGVLPCGLASVDEALAAGGFPRGVLSELRGGPASGKTAVALALVATMGREELTAWVDGAGELYPPAVAALGVDLDRFLLVRPATEPRVDLLWAAEALLSSGAFGAVIVVAWMLYRTPLGLAVRMVGENPEAAEAQGVDVARVRLGAVAFGSALMAIGGAFLTMSAFDAFYFNMVNGRGWICIALVVFARWTPGRPTTARRPGSRSYARRSPGTSPRPAGSRRRPARPPPRFATCAACSGRRSTTTIPAISISSRSPNRWRVAR